MTTDPRASAQPFPGDQQQRAPGLTSEMRPRPDHGEHSYVGKALLADRVALITGGDSGIGKAVAIAFAREGADVAISFLPVEQSDAEDTASWVEKAGRRAILLPGDIRDQAHCRALVERTVAAFGRLDILVNNAAHQTVNEGLDDVTAEQIDTAFRTNVFAMYYLAQAAVPHMKPGASIVNTTSVQARTGGPSMLVYAATKGAIASLTVALSNLLAPQGIRVNCVAPGPVWTPIQPIAKTPDQIRSLGEDVPLGRAGQPAELAGAFVLLASDAGSYMSGALIPVTGGVPNVLESPWRRPGVALVSPDRVAAGTVAARGIGTLLARPGTASDTAPGTAIRHRVRAPATVATPRRPVASAAATALRNRTPRAARLRCPPAARTVVRSPSTVRSRPPSADAPNRSGRTRC